jgi:hypothetical protein
MTQHTHTVGQQSVSRIELGLSTLSYYFYKSDLVIKM